MLDRQIGWFFAFENASGKDANLVRQIGGAAAKLIRPAKANPRKGAIEGSAWRAASAASCSGRRV
jgi:hypothetical protein